MKKESIKKLRKIYNGAIFQFHSPKSTSKPLKKICNTASLSKGQTSEKIIREIRKD